MKFSAHNPNDTDLLLYLKTLLPLGTLGAMFVRSLIGEILLILLGNDGTVLPFGLRSFT